MQPFNGVSPKPICTVKFVMFDNGQAQAECEAVSPFAVFHAIGKGMEVLAVQFQKQAQQGIQVAQADLLGRLTN